MIRMEQLDLAVLDANRVEVQDVNASNGKGIALLNNGVASNGKEYENGASRRIDVSAHIKNM